MLRLEVESESDDATKQKNNISPRRNCWEEEIHDMYPVLCLRRIHVSQVDHTACFSGG